MTSLQICTALLPFSLCASLPIVRPLVPSFPGYNARAWHRSVVQRQSVSHTPNPGARMVLTGVQRNTARPVMVRYRDSAAHISQWRRTL